MTQSPKFTIVTPCLNRADFIADAVESVLAQDYPDFEHIVMDGGSTDGTLEVLARYPHLKVHSGPDAGLYDAINRGVALAGGEVIGHLNSDDLFAEGAFHAVAEALAAHPEAQTVAGGADLLARGPSGGWHRVHTYPAARHAPLSLREITLGVPIVNARFFRRALYERVGCYDVAYPIGADREFLLRVLLAGEAEVNLDRVLYHYRSHPGSLTMRAGGPHALPRFREYLEMTERYAADPAMPPAVRAACRRWHLQAAIDGALEALRCLRPVDAWRFVARGWRHAPLFPASLAGAVVWRIARRPFKRA